MAIGSENAYEYWAKESLHKTLDRPWQIHGKWLSVDYISFFFIKYDSIPRPEDHWPPLYSFFIAPFFVILGKTAFAAKLPSLIISSLLLPVAVYYLTKNLSKNSWASLGAAFTVMFFPSMFMWSLYCLSDITFTFMVCMAVLFAIEGLDRGKYFYLMGIFLGLAYYSKGSALALIPAFPISYMVARGSFKAIFRDRKFLIGMLLVFLIICPWWIRNIIHFGNPFHTTQKYWSGYIGYGSGGSYPVYWDKPKPSFFATKLPLGTKVVAEKTKEYMDTSLQWALVDLPAKPGADPPINFKYFITLEAVRACFRDFPGYPIGLPIGFLGIPAFWGLFFLWRNRRIYIVPLVCGGLFLFLSIFWGPIDRLALPAIPLVAALGWTSYSALLGIICQWSSRFRIANYLKVTSTILIICGTLATIAYDAKANLYLYQEGVREGKYPYMDSQRKKNRITAAHWLRDNTQSEAIAMDVEPWDLHFYSDRRTVHTPSDNMERILWVMETYGVNYITYNDQDSLRPLFSGEIPGFELVNEQGLKIYQVDYGKIPKEYLH